VQKNNSWEKRKINESGKQIILNLNSIGKEKLKKMVVLGESKHHWEETKWLRA